MNPQSQPVLRYAVVAVVENEAKPLRGITIQCESVRTADFLAKTPGCFRPARTPSPHKETTALPGADPSRATAAPNQKYKETPK